VSWWPFRLLQEQGVHSLWATSFVYLLVSAAIVAWRPGAPLALLRTPALWPLFLASGLTNACFNWAVTIGDVIRVVLLFYLMPVWSALLARVLLGEPLRAPAIGRIVLALAGAGVVLAPADAPWPVPRGLADWLAIAGGAGFAMTNVMLRREAARAESLRAFAMFAGGMAVAGGLAVALAALGTVAVPPAPAAGWLAGIVGLALMFGVGNLCLQYGAARLAANVTSLVLLTEVVFAAVSAVLVGGEAMPLRTVAGGAMIVAAAALAVLGRR
jgi:drug/metabolite transporter (DMT)-like permease